MKKPSSIGQRKFKLTKEIHFYNIAFELQLNYEINNGP